MKVLVITYDYPGEEENDCGDHEIRAVVVRRPEWTEEQHIRQWCMEHKIYSSYYQAQEFDLEVL